MGFFFFLRLVFGRLLPVLALLLGLLEISEATLGVHQDESHLLEIRDLLRHHLAGARVNLATSYRNLGCRPMRYGTFPAQFRHHFCNMGSLDLWQVCRALRLQAALGVHLVAAVACCLPRQHNAWDTATLAS
jgi:hypothetical protein